MAFAQKRDSLLIYYGVVGKDERFQLEKPAARVVDSLRQLAGHGDTAAMMAMVEYYQLFELKPDSSRRYLEMAVKARVVEAAYLLGVAYLRGVEAPRKPAEARRLLEMAAQQGHILSLRVLWEELEPPDSVSPLRKPAWPHDARKAFEYALKAAELGDKPSMTAAGRYYIQGKGTARNDSLGYVWLRRAAEGGYLPAAVLLAEWALERWQAPAHAIRWAKVIQESPHVDIDLTYRARIAQYHAETIPQSINYLRQQLFLSEKEWTGPQWLRSSAQ